MIEIYVFPTGCVLVPTDCRHVTGNSCPQRVLKHSFTLPPFPSLQTLWIASQHNYIYTSFMCVVEKEMVTHSIILAQRIPWQRSLVGYSPWGGTESDTTEATQQQQQQQQQYYFFRFHIYELTQCVHINPKLSIYPSFPPFPTGNHKFIL